MHREVQFAQRLEQLLNGVREHDGTGGVGEQAGTRDERHNAHRHQHRIAHALGINGQKPDMHQRFALARHKEQVEHRREHHDGQDGLQALQDHFAGDLCHPVHHCQKQDGKGKAQRIGGCKQQHDISDGQHQLQARVEPVHQTVAREVLANGDISQHPAAPPFCFASRGSTRLSPASRRRLASRIILTA